MANITDLRNVLYAQLDALQDPNINLEREIKRTDAIINVSEQIINTGKLECQMISTAVAAKMQAVPTDFFGSDKQITDGK